MDSIREQKSNKTVETKYGGVQGLLKALKTDEEKGIPATSLSLRHQQFGTNQPIVKEATTFWEFVWECFEDLTLRILIVASFISEIIGIYQTINTGEPEYVEGLGIFMAIFIVVMVTSVNNYSKELQFRKLSEESQERNITVVRDSKEKTISVFDLVVGDIAKVGIGDVMPVDALVLWSMNLSLDESTVTGEPDQLKKDPHEHPFLLSGSQIADGTARVVVLTVGSKTFLGKNLESIMNVEETDTPLQQKLNYIAELIGKIGLTVALLTFAVCLGQKLYHAYGQGFPFEETFNAVLDPFIIAVTIVVVAVPEGLPLAVTLSLAFSVNQMKKENNLVRHLDASETMGQATNICSDKTGTLTQNVMTVKSICIGKPEGLLETLDKSKICQEVMTYLGLHFCHNTNASYTATAGGEQFTGSRTEIALLKLAKTWGFDYEKIRHQNKIKLQVPFNSKLKRMATVVEEDGQIYVFVKGASEVIVNMCHKHINHDKGHTHVLDESEKQEIYDKIIMNYAHRAYRTLGISYKIVKKGDWKKFLNDDGTVNFTKLESKLILLAVVGIQDPVRNGVPEAVRKCQNAGITVRMVTGDNKETAQAIAKECGIIPNSYKYEEGDNIVMTGLEFRTLVGEELVPKPGSKDKVVEKLDVFTKIVKTLKVLARSSPQDKLILVTGLRQLNEVVAVTGDGSNDAPALKKSNVGFSMHIAGTQLAQEASDIILLDDNFSSIVVAVLWGRNIYDCISKFIQFQLTVNIVALTMCFIGSIIGGDSPITPIQMLWVNLIMDTFAALALATEPPNDSLLSRPPVKHDDSLLTVDMIKTITGQSIYQLCWLFFILYGMVHFREGLFSQIYLECPSDSGNSGSHEEPSTNNTAPTDSNKTEPAAVARFNSEVGGERCFEYTLFFQVFVMMQVFNEINCRKLKSSELNVFSGFFNNWMFIFIVAITVVAQIAIVQYGGLIFQTTPLTLHQHLFALAVGLGGLIFGILFRLVPTKLFSCFKFKEEEKKESTFTTLVRKKTTRRAPVKHS